MDEEKDVFGKFLEDVSFLLLYPITLLLALAFARDKKQHFMI